MKHWGSTLPRSPQKTQKNKGFLGMEPFPPTGCLTDLRKPLEVVKQIGSYEFSGK